jgi:AraC-like DNA-binding protein
MKSAGCLKIRDSRTMPLIIRQTLAERIRRLPEMRSFLDDFHKGTGVRVEFVGPLGHRDDAPPCGRLCAQVHASAAGQRMCTRTVHKLLESAQEHPARVRCDAGLLEAAVPLRAGGQTFGFLLFNGFFSEKQGSAEINRLRHMLDRLHLDCPRAELESLCTDTPVLSTDRVDALGRLLGLAASHLVLSITDNLATPEEKLPALVSRACTLVKRSFTQKLTLAQMARRLRVSPEHLCRLFHHSTGLRFREYVSRLRAEHARAKLLSTEKRIVDIAFAAGFQSLSQFNRRFKAIYGVTPQALRTAGRSRME